MADVEISTMTSRTEIRDSAAYLHPRVLDQLKEILKPFLEEWLRHERDVKQEQKMRPSMTSREVDNWE
jgi:hypothetical protein